MAKSSAAATPATLRMPSNLAFTRAFEVGPGLMFAEYPQNPAGKSRAVQAEAELDQSAGLRRVPIEQQERGKRTTAGYKETAESLQARGDDSRNLAFGNDAALPADCSTLCVTTWIKILPLAASPYSCDDTQWYQKLVLALERARNSPVLDTLGRNYAYNMVNGSWLWRNRDVADQLEVSAVITSADAEATTVTIPDALDMPLRPVSTTGQHPHAAEPRIDTLAQLITAALRGEKHCVRIELTARAGLCRGQAVWPSQIYSPRKEKVGKQEIGRAYFTVNYDGSKMVALTPEKIGNALRTFDAYHQNADYRDEIVAIEPFAGSLRLGKKLREARRKNTLYELLPRFVGMDPNASSMGDEEILFVLANLVRGGVFGESSKTEALEAGAADGQESAQ